MHVLERPLRRVARDRGRGQLVDLYSHNVDYVGARIDGNGGGDFLIAGPGWQGETPPGIVRAIRIPTEILYSQFRTQLYDDADLERVRAIQAGYGVGDARGP